MHQFEPFGGLYSETTFWCNTAWALIGSDPIEIGDIGPKVKVNVTENVSKNNENNLLKNQLLSFFESKTVIW